MRFNPTKSEFQDDLYVHRLCINQRKKQSLLQLVTPEFETRIDISLVDIPFGGNYVVYVAGRLSFPYLPSPVSFVRQSSAETSSSLREGREREGFKYRILDFEPLFQVTWYLDGQRILPDLRHNFEEHDTLAALRLRDIQVRDMGNYSCQAENSVGRARDYIELSGKVKILF